MYSHGWFKHLLNCDFLTFFAHGKLPSVFYLSPSTELVIPKISLSLPPPVSGVIPPSRKVGIQLHLVANTGILTWQPATGRSHGEPVFSWRKMGRGLHVEFKALSNGEKAVAPAVGSGVKEGEHDAIVIAATQPAVKGAEVLVLEKYVTPGGSSGYYRRDGYMFDVGASMMFGFSDKENLNSITQALEDLGCKMQVIPDPTTVHFHLPDGISVRVHRDFGDFIAELIKHLPHEKEEISKFYGEC